jgi:hypothetical protein
LVVDTPVDRDPTLLALVLIPDEADVESAPSALFAVDRPLDAEVDKEPTVLAFVLMPDDAEVDREPA